MFMYKCNQTIKLINKYVLIYLYKSHLTQKMKLAIGELLHGLIVDGKRMNDKIQNYFKNEYNGIDALLF